MAIFEISKFFAVLDSVRSGQGEYPSNLTNKNFDLVQWGSYTHQPGCATRIRVDCVFLQFSQHAFLTHTAQCNVRVSFLFFCFLFKFYMIIMCCISEDKHVYNNISAFQNNLRVKCELVYPENENIQKHVVTFYACPMSSTSLNLLVKQIFARSSRTSWASLSCILVVYKLIYHKPRN